ncbi:MAG: pyruvate, phosphate dikinase [Deltaproteobacteria bacterium]|nr:pyruvate, phosphate dikinase [Deltaproteobacteria bacterium]
MKRWVYFYGNGRAEGGSDKALLGGKGAGLAEMTSIGIPVPPGFTISTEACQAYYAQGHRFPDGLESQLREAMAEVERTVGKRFGDPDNPLLVSVRSGARASMPGMMDTVLNLGLNDRTLQGLIAKTKDPRFAYDSFRRFAMMYGDVVLGLKPDAATEVDVFEEALADKKRARNVRLDNELDAEALKELVLEFKALIKEHAKKDFPEDPWEQLMGAIGAVFRSWDNQRARTYRKLHNIPAEWGTAVNICTMVFGNLGDDSATGVAFTRDPNTGEKRFFGEYLINAQGEDVVAGIRTPQPINAASAGDASQSLERKMPKLYAELDAIRLRLEKHYRDMQDLEFTIEKGKLWLLQTRTGKRSAPSAVRIAVEMVQEGLIDEKTAIQRVTPAQLDALLHPMVDPTAKPTVLAKGLPASPGAATGKVVLTADDAEAAGKRREAVILVRTETSPEDVHGLHYARGVLTSRGGMTSHAAVVARGMGRPCVVGAGELIIDYHKRTITARGKTVREGDMVTIDGTSGQVLMGEVPTVQPSGSNEYQQLMTWADQVRRLRVRANADTPKDAETARKHGAEGIGLCRTEHMFFEPSRILAVREMIIADDEAGRRAALAKILPMQRADFEGIFAAMDGLPVTIRLLDPPLHEFLPQDPEDIAAVGKELRRDPEVIRARVVALHEFNPMLGLRGCRLGLVHPEIYEMQVKAIIEAAAVCAQRGVNVLPEIMIPLVGAPEELERLRKLVVDTADAALREHGSKVAYTVGTMIEVPRAALLADQVAKHADFFSFGTNDLTQMTFGLSRDDSGSFLPRYVELGILADEPFTVLDQQGVGMLVKWAVERGRTTKPKLKVGICGEHGGEPRSVAFCHDVGLDYVSCSPFRVPIARLAAAQAVLAPK